MWNKSFRITLLISIVLVYIVIIAGAVVRMTGSGMGCPDWPKCFGYLIPPTKSAQLDWKPNHIYKEGQSIIKDKAIYVVKKDFTSKENYNLQNWEKYIKHDYAIFNPIHTWIEYLNRLVTVVFGIPLFLLFIFSIFRWKVDKRLLLFSTITLLCVAVEAILGKIVVDTNLQPVKITLHVLFVFFIISFLLILLFIFKQPKPLVQKDSLVNKLGILAVLITLLQVVLGTFVRQYIDVQMQLNAHVNPENWLATPPVVFYIHRSFSVLVIAVNVFWIWLHKNNGGTLTLLNWVAFLLVLEATSGLTLYYLDFPFLSQPLHLLLSSLLFGVQFYAVLKLLNQVKSSRKQ